MKLFALAFLTVIGLAAAQLEILNEVPKCALECFTTSIASTECSLTDFYCQCGKNAKVIQDTTLECLCNSECTTSDLAQVYSISNKLCTETLAEHGETYDQPPSLKSGICNAGKTHTSQAAGNSSSAAQPTSAGNDTSPAAPIGSSADFEGAAAVGSKMNIAAIAAGGFAFLVI